MTGERRIGDEPAFPVGSGDMRDPVGMSLRDYLAAQCITGCLPGSLMYDTDVADRARWAYRMADAMLRARAASGEAEERENV